MFKKNSEEDEISELSKQIPKDKSIIIYYLIYTVKINNHNIKDKEKVSRFSIFSRKKKDGI